MLLLSFGCERNTHPRQASTADSSTQSDLNMHDIVFLTRDGCVNTPVMKKNLDAAMAQISDAIQISFIDQAALPTNDYRASYSTPTILVSGDDLFGLPRLKETMAAPS